MAGDRQLTQQRGGVANKDQAIEATKQVGVKSGDTIYLQSQGQIENPHHHSCQTSDPTHVDGWAVTNDGSNYTAEKGHSDD